MKLSVRRISRTLINIAAVLLLMAVSSLLSYSFQQPGWFSLLLLCTMYLGLYGELRLAAVSAVIFPLYSILFSAVMLSPGFTTKTLFVPLVWLGVAYFIARIRTLHQRNRDQESRLRDNQAFHRHIVEGSPIGIFNTDLEGTITFCNDQLVRMYGGDRKEQFLNKKAFDFITPNKDYLEKQVIHSPDFQYVLRSVEYTARRLDGSAFEAELSGALTRNSTCEVTGFVGFIHDASEKKQAHREALCLRRLLDYSRDAIVIQSLEDGRIADVNRITCEISGFSREQLQQKSLFDFNTGPLSEEEIMRELRRTGHFRFETRTICRDGTLLSVEADLSLMAQGNERYLLAIIRDISERKALEQKTEERRRYLEGILQSSHDAIVTLNQDCTVREWNPGAEALFGYSAEEAAGRHIDSLVTGGNDERHAEARELSEEVKRGSIIASQEALRYRKDGTSVPVLLSAAPIRINDEIAGFVGSYTDVSQLKSAEAQVRRLLEEKENLLREVHHRIKNHMNVIRSIFSLQRQKIPHGEAGEILREAENRIALMQKIYQTLYTQEDTSSIGLRSLTEELLGDLSRTFGASVPARLRTDIEPLEVSARYSLPIGIIVIELVTNAYKYAFPEGASGTIGVSIRRPEPGTLEITVADDGRGIPDEKTDPDQFGFGLSLIRGYVQQFDGEMEIDNRSGSRIRVSLVMEQSRPTA
jgi:PAS domain S-box-containing protein